jgi:hypothetical protein
MNELSFDIKQSKDFFHKLVQDFAEYSIDKTSSRVALNLAMTGWHLTEWIYNEFNPILRPRFQTLGIFQNNIKQQCQSLQIMHDLANGTKHYLLTRHTTVIKESNLHRGAFSNAFSRAFDISTLRISLKDGTVLYFEDEITKVIDFWREYFNRELNIIV